MGDGFVQVFKSFTDFCLLIYLFCQVQKEEFWNVQLLYRFVSLDFSLPGCQAQLSNGYQKSYGFVDYELFLIVKVGVTFSCGFLYSTKSETKSHFLFLNKRVPSVSFLTCKIGKTSDRSVSWPPGRGRQELSMTECPQSHASHLRPIQGTSTLRKMFHKSVQLFKLLFLFLSPLFFHLPSTLLPFYLTLFF